MAESIEHQRDVTRLLLSVVDDAGFALAGSGAIREHGVTARPTEDVDLFTSRVGVESFSRAIERGTEALQENGYQVVEARRADQYARLHVTAPDGHVLEVDLGLDWREHDPVQLDVGPVLALPDAVANKVGALYSRAEVRDYLDVDSIRQASVFSDDQLLELTAEHDAGFDRLMFASQLAHVRDLTANDVAEYGVDADQLAGIKERLAEWSTQLQPTPTPGESPTLSRTRDTSPAVEPYRSDSAGHPRDAVRSTPDNNAGSREYRPPAPGDNRTMGYGR